MRRVGNLTLLGVVDDPLDGVFVRVTPKLALGLRVQILVVVTVVTSRTFREVLGIGEVRDGEVVAVRILELAGDFLIHVVGERISGGHHRVHDAILHVVCTHGAT